MKKFNFSLVLLLCIGLFFIACEKDVVTPSVEQNAVTSAVEQEKVTSEQGLLIPSSIIIEFYSGEILTRC